MEVGLSGAILGGGGDGRIVGHALRSKSSRTPISPPSSIAGSLHARPPPLALEPSTGSSAFYPRWLLVQDVPLFGFVHLFPTAPAEIVSDDNNYPNNNLELCSHQVLNALQTCTFPCHYVARHRSFVFARPAPFATSSIFHLHDHLAHHPPSAGSASLSYHLRESLTLPILVPKTVFVFLGPHV